MPQTKDSYGESSKVYSEISEEYFKEASFHYVIRAFEEICEEDTIKVWKFLPTHIKAEMRRMMAIEQIKAGEL